MEVLKSFKERSNNRQSEYNSTSKEDNPVVALPGSPGIGKSTFLSRFPLNSGYITFAGQPLIVSVITFKANFSKLGRILWITPLM